MKLLLVLGLITSVLPVSINAGVVGHNARQQSLICWNEPNLSGTKTELFKGSVKDLMIGYGYNWIESCHFEGTYILYSEPNFRGDIKWGGFGERIAVKDLPPAESGPFYDRTKSIRRVGDAYQWNANTLTFYNGENFTGAKEISFGDNNKRTLNLKKTEVPNPSSMIITGCGLWTLYNDTDYKGECSVLSGDMDIGYPDFYPSKQEIYKQIKIKEVNSVTRGCECNSDNRCKTYKYEHGICKN